LRVLIAEDDAVSRRVLRRFLEKWGYEVSEAEDGERAWELLQQEQFGVLVTDWMMPRCDGVELVRRVRGLETSEYTYVILLTAKSEKEDLVEGIQAGADDFVSKPFDRGELEARLRAGARVIELERDLAVRNEQLKATNERIRRDLRAAAKLQEALLPKGFPTFGDVAFSWVFQPCDELAGDFLNYFRLDESHIGLYVLDVSGHGVAAALLSVTLSRLLSPVPDQASLVKKFSSASQRYHIVPPVEVAEQLNRRFLMEGDPERFCTLFYGVLDLNSHELHYVCAGHPGPVYVPAQGDLVVVENFALPIGIDEDPEYEEKVLQLNRGDRFYLYSDGLVDAANENHDRFEDHRLLATIAEARKDDLHDSIGQVMRRVEAWHGSPGSKDDISMLAIEVGVSPRLDGLEPGDAERSADTAQEAPLENPA